MPKIMMWYEMILDHPACAQVRQKSRWSSPQGSPGRQSAQKVTLWQAIGAVIRTDMHQAWAGSDRSAPYAQVVQKSRVDSDRQVDQDQHLDLALLDAIFSLPTWREDCARA